MIWSGLFLIGAVQGLFLITLVIGRRSTNGLASRLTVAMIAPMVIVNSAYLAIRTDAAFYFPQAFALSWGIVFLYGPLFYLYCRSIADSDFRWTFRTWWHMLPYGLQMALAVPLFFDSRDMWAQFIRDLLAGQLPVVSATKVSFALQSVHFLTYLGLTLRWMQTRYGDAVPYVVPVAARLHWIKTLFYAFCVLWVTVTATMGYVVARGTYNPVTNYINTIAITGIVYFVAFRFLLNPQLISPDFSPKYKTYMSFTGAEGEVYRQKLLVLLERDKIYTDPELKLATVADALDLPPHQVSKLINDRFAKTFTDLINAYRVQEFIRRANDPLYQSHSVLALALDVGFNSKSAFNNAFKKITGKTPSEFRKEA